MENGKSTEQCYMIERTVQCNVHGHCVQYIVVLNRKYTETQKVWCCTESIVSNGQYLHCPAVQGYIESILYSFCMYP